MAQNDFFPVVYKILAELYNNLKEDQTNDIRMFDNESYDIKQSFFEYIINYLIDEKYIANVKKNKYDRGCKYIGLKEAQITPKGIEYLQDNSIMAKTKLFLLYKKI